MSIPDPILNCRAPQSVKDALHLLASRRQLEPGPLQRLYLIERLVVEAALDCLRTWGFEETLRRLSQPSPVLTQHSTNTEQYCTEQTKDTLVKHGKTKVSP